MINHKDFVGKTVASVDDTAVNCVVFHFTDGTQAELETVACLPSLGLYGIQSARADLQTTVKDLLATEDNQAFAAGMEKAAKTQEFPF